MDSRHQQSEERTPSERGRLIENILTVFKTSTRGLTENLTKHRYEELKSSLEAVPLWAIPLIIARFPHTPMRSMVGVL
ncbi:hypothetical protein N7495_003144 [Penicillium taxi]|uniref:uncharacterized protein n=1 Tax=Penicillium taxi TaxID=168475 RepID=UPI00254588AA|nr:uncharacterized protein N7495_003144 [Penicillium taxi]KAJ5902616.1 hypothetical protein N7495_003144 [Penicillium taxi]